MFGGRVSKKPDKPKPRRNLSQYGLIDIPNFDGSVGEDDMDDDNDEDLEAELAALTGGGSTAKPKPKKTPIPDSQLDMMIADSLKDIPSDDDVSVDENDPELLGELSELQGDDVQAPPSAPPSHIMDFPTPTSQVDPVVSMLTERIAMYESAETNAKATNDSSKARRFGRGLKTLQDLLKKAKSGAPINQEDVPPPVSIAKPAPPAEPPQTDERSNLPPPLEPTRVAPAVPSSPVRVAPSVPVTPSEPTQEEFPPPIPPRTRKVEEQTKVDVPQPSGATDVITILTSRQNEYKRAALEAKKSGDQQHALTLISIFKQFETVINLAKSGQTIDLSDMPPPPSELSKVTQQDPSPAEVPQDDPNPSSASVPQPQTSEASAPTPAPLAIPDAPKSVLEGLVQRLEKYQSQEESAKSEGNSSKARRMGRIVKQYQDAIKLHKAGKPVPLEELPVPPGYPPFPGETPAAPITIPTGPSAVTPQPVPIPSTPQGPTTSSEEISPTKSNVRKSAGTRQEKQLNLLLQRQKSFKLAAVNAKKKGEINQAKEYLRLVKQLDPLIAASESGLPVDLATVPIPPEEKKSLESEFEVISIDELVEGSDSDVYEKLQKDLMEQMKMCMRTRDHFKAVGDIASANKFEQLALHSKKDLDVIRASQKRSDPVPKFHYEERTFSMVVCNTDLNDNDLELTIVQGISYNVTNPNEIDTYVKYTFPYPTETPLVGKTETIYNTNNPEYNAKFTIPIQRQVRACQRVFKRHAIKLEVWSKGGFFRSDTLVGTVNVKLQPLETKCTLHEALDLMDGRKVIGGKLEVKIRIRNPIVAKQLEQVKEKWLRID